MAQKEADHSANKWNEIGFSGAWFFPSEERIGTAIRHIQIEGFLGMSFRRQWVQQLSWELGVNYRQFYRFYQGLVPGNSGFIGQFKERQGSLWMPVRANYQSVGKSGFCLGAGFELGSHVFDVKSRLNDPQNGSWQEIERNVQPRYLQAAPLFHAGVFSSWNDMVSIRLEASLNLREASLTGLLRPRFAFTLFTNID